MRLLCFSDLHRSVEGARRLLALAAREGVDVLVSAGDLATDEEHDSELYKVLAESQRPLFAVPGNHDGAGYAAHLRAAKALDLDGRQARYAGYTFAGWGLRDLDPGVTGPRTSQAEDSVLELIVGRLSSVEPARVVLVSHLPPWGVRSSRNDRGEDWGNAQLRAWVESFQPAAVICGHVHGPRSRTSRIGRTLVVNGGPVGHVLHLPSLEEENA